LHPVQKWLTTLVPDLDRPFWLQLRPESRELWKACKAKFFDHQRELVKTSTTVLSRDEWNALSEEDKQKKMELDEQVKVSLWEDRLDEREVRELRAFEAARKEKYRKNKEASARREENKKARMEEEERQLVAAQLERDAADKAEPAKEATQAGGELDVVNPTEAQTEPEEESVFGAGIPLPARRGRLRRG
jgi:hypothetical protein